MNAIDILDGLQSLGFAVAAEGDQLTLTGQIELLDERRRSLIRDHKRDLLCLLACHHEDARRGAEPCSRCSGTTVIDGASYRWCESCGEKLGPSAWQSQLERDGIRFADSPDADEPLNDLTAWFESQPHANEVDSRCNHNSNVNAGSWHMQSGRLSCRHCGGFYQTVVARAGDSARKEKAKSREVGASRLF